MPHITKVLGNEVGIQFDRVKDNTGSTGTAPINGMIVGQFKRGRTDKPMIITSANLNATLGYDPDNPDFVAVQDALKTNIPYISVMRVVNDEINNEFECLGNSSTAIATGSYSGKYEITINDISHPPLSQFFPDRPEIDGIRVFLDISKPTLELIDRLHFQNLNSEIKKIIVKLVGDEISAVDYFQKLDTENNEIDQVIEYSDYIEGLGYKQISFCLRELS